MPPMPAEAEAPPDLVMPADAEPGRFGLPRALFQHVDRGHVGIEQIEIGKGLRQQRRIGEAGELVLGRGARHGDGALGQPSTPSPRISLVEIDACLWPTMTRKPTSSPSERCDSSTAPSRTSTDSETERTATASA